MDFAYMVTVLEFLEDPLKAVQAVRGLLKRALSGVTELGSIS
jgi:hypothetical protein